MALDNVSRCDQMLTVGSYMFRQVGGRHVTAKSIGSIKSMASFSGAASVIGHERRWCTSHRS